MDPIIYAITSTYHSDSIAITGTMGVATCLGQRLRVLSRLGIGHKLPGAGFHAAVSRSVPARKPDDLRTGLIPGHQETTKLLHFSDPVPLLSVTGSRRASFDSLDHLPGAPAGNMEASSRGVSA